MVEYHTNLISSPQVTFSVHVALCARSLLNPLSLWQSVNVSTGADV